MEKERKAANSSHDNSKSTIDFSKLDFGQLKPVPRKIKSFKTIIPSHHTESIPNNNDA